MRCGPTRSGVEHTDLEDAPLHLTHDTTCGMRPRTLRADGRYVSFSWRLSSANSTDRLTWRCCDRIGSILRLVGRRRRPQRLTGRQDVTRRRSPPVVCGDGGYPPAPPASTPTQSSEPKPASSGRSGFDRRPRCSATEPGPNRCGSGGSHGSVARGVWMLPSLSGGHAGGEWSGRTLKNLLTQHGRRREVLGAKLISLWLAGVGLIAVCWGALALAGRCDRRRRPRPNPAPVGDRRG